MQRMRRIKHQQELIQYGAIFIASFIFGTCGAVIVESIWPNASPSVETLAIILTIAISIIVVWMS